MNQSSDDTNSHGTPSIGQRALKEGQYRRLPEELRRGGFTYRLRTREGDVAIYQQSWSSTKEPSECFEVIRIRVDPPREIRGKWLEASERYPGNEDWGKFAWTYTDWDKALSKFKTLTP